MVAKYEAPRTKLTIDWHSNISDKEINNLVNVHATHFEKIVRDYTYGSLHSYGKVLLPHTCHEHLP